MDNIEQRYGQSLSVLEALGAFHRSGAAAYHPGLDNIRALDAALGNPSQSFAAVHVGGTNGKGSTSSLLASVLTSAGYRTGLYTSPHLLDFRERIRVDGKMVPREFVADFTERLMALRLPQQPSYFEAATAMAFEWFRRCAVDVAVVEVGLGGRLDSTNIVRPLVSVITNISLDHTALLGDTVEAIAAEKAGIFKPGVPAVIGSAGASVRAVFDGAAVKAGTRLVYAEDYPLYTSVEEAAGCDVYTGTTWGTVRNPLTGSFQRQNTATVLSALAVLSADFDIESQAVHHGFENVVAQSGLAGRWMHVGCRGVQCVCDTGHNPGAWQYLGPQLQKIADGGRLRLVLGFLADKDLSGIVRYMPHGAVYYFTMPDSNRARTADNTAAVFAAAGMTGHVYVSPSDAFRAVFDDAAAGDVVFAGGSTFVVSAFLAYVNRQNGSPS